MAQELFETARADLQARIVRRARADPAYRERLRAEPGAAIADELGVPLPPGMSVTVVEERTDHLCVVLPVDATGVGADAIAAMTGLWHGDFSPRGAS